MSQYQPQPHYAPYQDPVFNPQPFQHSMETDPLSHYPKQAKYTNLAMSVLDTISFAFQILCVVDIITSGLRQDYIYDVGIQLYVTFSLFFAVYLMRLIGTFVYCCYDVSTKQKKTVAFGFITAPIKYHLFRLRVPNEQVRMRALLNWDIIGALYLLISGTCSVLTYNGAKKGDSYLQKDTTFLYFGFALLSSSVFSIITLVMNRKWIKRQVQLQKLRLIQRALAQPLLGNSFNALPVEANSDSLYMGYPVGQQQPGQQPLGQPTYNVPVYNPNANLQYPQNH